MKDKIKIIQNQAAFGAMHWLNVAAFFEEARRPILAAFARSAAFALRGISGWDL